MEIYNILYESQHQILICREHGYAIPPSALILHLRRLHAAKGAQLREALAAAHDLRLSPPEQVLPPTTITTPVAGLTIHRAYQCDLPACNGENGALSQHRRTVEKHQAKIHGVRKQQQRWRRKRTSQSLAAAPVTEENNELCVREVCVQSFFDIRSSYYRLFVVQPLSLLPPLPAENQSAVQAKLNTMFQKSQQIWNEGFERLPSPDSMQSEAHTPPWLRSTGIASFLGRLEIYTKASLRELLAPIDGLSPGESSAELLIEQGVKHQLHAARQRALPGASRESINRVAARILNSFEPGRMQSRPFWGVQERNTMDRYAVQWSGCLLLLCRIYSRPAYSDLKTQLLSGQPDLLQACTRLYTAAETLHAANRENHSFKECLNAYRSASTENIGEDDHDSDDSSLSCPSSTESINDDDSSAGSETTDRSLGLHARALNDAIGQLSTALVHQEYDQDPLQTGVVAYCALHTLRHTGAWMPALAFTSFLSGIIHCMQLWLLADCLHRYEQFKKPLMRFEEIVRQQCARYLINTAPTPIAELSYWRLLCRSASEDTVSYAVTTISPDCTQVNHLHLELRLSDWTDALRRLFDSTTETLNRELLLDLTEVPRYSVELLHDNPGDFRPGKCFIDDPRNQLHVVQDWLYHRLRSHPHLQARFLTRPTEAAAADDAILRRSAVEVFLHANQRFLRQLATLMYLSAGLPPRRRELAMLLWCNQETARNIYLHYGYVALITGYHKSQWRIGTRPVARFLPPKVGELLVRYLIYVPPFLRFLLHGIGRPSARGQLFFANDDCMWSGDQIGSCIKRQTTLLLGMTLTPRQWRHIAIALDRRLLQGIGCRTFGITTHWGQTKPHAVDGSETELDGDGDPGVEAEGGGGGGNDGNGGGGIMTAIHHLQASHTQTTGNRVYGNDLSLRQGLTDALLHAYFVVSQSWHRLARLDPESMATACSRKRAASNPLDVSIAFVRSAPPPMQGSKLLVRRQLWNWPALERGLQQLFGPDARPRSQSQRDGLCLVARSRPETIIVMPTGSGKTLLYVVPTLLPGAQVTVIVVPLTALKQDLLRRCQEWGIAPLCYRSASAAAPTAADDRVRLHAVPSLVFVDVETAATHSFLAFLRSLHAAGRLDRVIIDEVHLVLTAAHYRECMGLLGEIRRIACPFVCVTATLPPSAMMELRTRLFLVCPETLRVSSDRPNLQYCVQTLSAPIGPDRSRDELLLDAAAVICEQDRRQWLNSSDSGATVAVDVDLVDAGAVIAITAAAATTARGICFVRTTAIGVKLARRLQCGFYHGGLDLLERERISTAWSRGSGAVWIVATSAFGAGVDYPHVRRVLHVDAPTGLIDYAQETGRAGRDGLPAVCLTLLAAGWTVSWNSGFVSDFLSEDRMQMASFLRSRRCLRRQLAIYLDGEPGVDCSADEGGREPRTACGICLDSIPRLPSPPPPPPPPPGPGAFPSPSSPRALPPSPSPPPSSSSSASAFAVVAAVARPHAAAAKAPRRQAFLYVQPASPPPPPQISSPQLSSASNLSPLISSSILSASNSSFADSITNANYLNRFGIISGMESGIESGMESSIKSGMKSDMESGMESDMEFNMKSDIKSGMKSNIKSNFEFETADFNYDLAARLAYNTARDTEEGYNDYESRVIRWGEPGCCIPCSFQHRRYIDGHHVDCVQQRHIAAISEFRITYARYSACWGCGQPQSICDRRRQGGCMQPTLLVHACWTIFQLDPDGAELVTLLGGPDLSRPGPARARARYPYLAWLGRASKLYGRQASNAARLLNQWLDRLEALCMQTPKADQ